MDELLDKFEMKESSSVQTLKVSRLSATGSGEKLDSGDHELHRAVVGSLLYLSCLSRPDIAFAVSELSRFVFEPCKMHM